MKSTSSYKLIELLIPKQLMFSVKPLDIYKQIKLRTKHQGVELRGFKKGNEIGSKQYLAKKGQFIISKIDARNGAMGIIPENLDNAIVTGDFLLYNFNENLIHPKYFSYISQTPSFDASCKKCSEGSTNRVRLKLDRFLDLSVELPSIEIQETIVDKIERIKSKIETIQKLRFELEREINNLRYSLMCECEANFDKIEIGSICNLKKGSFAIMKTEPGEYPFVVTAAEFKTANNFDFDCEATCVPLVSSTGHGNAAMHRVHYIKGKFALPNLLCAVTAKENKQVNTRFLYELFMAKKDEYFVPLMKGTSNVSLSVDKISSVEIPLPPIKEQNYIVEILKKVNDIRQTHKEQEKELTQLLPSLLDKAFKGELFLDELAEIIPIAGKPEVSYTQVKSLIPGNRKGFAKQVLGGKIVSLFKDDKHFTNIKFQKLQYLAEHIIEEDLYWNYYRQSAGPYDNKFMHSVFSKLEQNQWFVNRNYKFYSLQKANDIERHYQNYFGNKEEKLSKLFGLLSNASEKFCEAVATIYAVWNNHIIQNLAFDKSKIKTDFFDWSIRKEQQFTVEEFEKALEWMNKHDIVPTGFGCLIKEKK